MEKIISWLTIPLNRRRIAMMKAGTIALAAISALLLLGFSSSTASGDATAVDDSYSTGAGALSTINVTRRSTTTCTDISDIPLDALNRGVPPIVMFIPDDSGSMDWEFMVPDSDDGRFGDAGYVFPNLGDNTYNENEYYLSDTGKRTWKTQWGGYNFIYYSPHREYRPWPMLEDADLVNPRSHPNRATPTINLDDTFKTVEGEMYVLDNPGTFHGPDSLFRDTGTGGPFTATYEQWRRSLTEGYYGGTRAINSYDSGSTASWVPDLAESGEHEVLVWYPPHTERDRQAPYQIVHSEGAAWEALDQSDLSYAGQWQSLGTYYFNKDGNDLGPSGVTLFRCDDGNPVGSGHDPSGETSDWTNHSTHTNADALAFIPATGGTILVRNAHYYVLADDNGNGNYDSGETVYLVNLNHDTEIIEYYQVLTAGEVVGDGQLLRVPVEEVADSVRPRNADGTYRTYLQERQNFANWYSYYRRRQHTSIGAMANTIYDLENVYVGFRSLHGDMLKEAVPIRIQDEECKLNELLDMLYDYEQQEKDTPLRKALRAVGRYLDHTTTKNGGIGSSPWRSEEEGGECQQAFAILMTDGFWNGGSPYVGNVDGDFESPYKDSYPSTLADVAMHFYHRDLVPDLPDEVPTNSYDQADWQHMVTYGVSFGLYGTLNPDDYNVYSPSPEDHPTWPMPVEKTRTTIDDLWHASVNGRGEFLSARDPDELVQSLKDIMMSIQSRTGSASPVSVNGDQLYSVLGEQTRMFQARYNAGTMVGDVLGYPLYLIQDEQDEQVVKVRRPPAYSSQELVIEHDDCKELGEVLIDHPVWSAAELLDYRLQNHTHQHRVVITRSLAPDGEGIPFTYSAVSQSGTTKQLEYLTPDWSTSAEATTENLINYFRGDKTWELTAGPFRNRTHLLADIVNSSPYFHNNILYVGANDGMLHALDAGTGDELFAYVPGLVYENLKEYANPAYSHKFYVDQAPNVRKRVNFGGDVEKTVLVGGLGKGGKGYYALDITGLSGSTGYWGQTPHSVLGQTEAQMAARVLWEFPHVSDPAYDEIVEDMGYSFSNTTITRTYSEEYPWVVIFGNGYNSENSSAVLFIVDVTDGTLIHKIDTGVTNCNGLSTPFGSDASLDGKVDYVYAGDLQGNLWKFDLTSTDFNDWAVAYANEGVPQPLFQATGPVGPNGTLQPITTRPSVVSHPLRHGFLVVFGTGKYLGISDIGDESVQSIYGIWDYGDDDDSTEYLGKFLRGEKPQLSAPHLDHEVYLLEQTFTEHAHEVYDACLNPPDYKEEILRVVSDNPADWTVTTTPDEGASCGHYPESEFPCDPWASGDYPDPLRTAGWYMDLHSYGEPGWGERLIVNPQIRLGALTYITFRPNQFPCGGEGESDVFKVDPVTGGNLEKPVFDINNDGIIDEDDLINIGTEANPIWVAPSSRRSTGRLQAPAIIRISADIERMYFTTPQGDIAQINTDAAKMGILFWKDMMQE